MSRIHRLVIPLQFPEGLHPGAGKDLANRLTISYDGQGRPVLRGSSFAGILRHAYEAEDPRGTPFHFGRANDEVQEVAASRLEVADIVLDTGKSMAVSRHHNSMDRHSGAVRHGSLFDLDALPPGTRGTAVLVYREGDDIEENDSAATRAFLARLLGLFDSGLSAGGSSARGIGRMEVKEKSALYREFDLANLDDHAAWLDEQYTWRGGAFPQTSSEVLEPARGAEKPPLRVDLTLSIPPGQDLLIADGQGVDYELEPQHVIAADGTKQWRLPGASLRGVLRAWMSRLAVLDGLQVDDRVARYLEGRRGSGEHIAWGFDNPLHKQDAMPDCSIHALFGSALVKGRIHVTDGYCPANEHHEQARMHVAVDRITGGASDGFLFDNSVLIGPVAFPVTIHIQAAEDHEAQWLARSLRALDQGLIRVGSSKAVGVLRLQSLTASGPGMEHFANLVGQEEEV